MKSRQTRPSTPEPESASSVSEGVRGERGVPTVSAERSLQSRISSIMACSLMMILGVAMLWWYYSNALSRQSKTRATAQSAVLRKAQGEMPLPAIDALSSLENLLSANSRSRSDSRVGARSAAVAAPPDLDALSATQLASVAPPELPLVTAQPRWRTTAGGNGSALRKKSSEQLMEERLLAGTAFARDSISGSGMGATVGRGAALPTLDTVAAPRAVGAPAPAASLANTADDDDSAGNLSTLLRPTAVTAVHAEVVPTRRLLLPKGTFIDCTLETAIDSTLPGMTTCITATDTFSSDGTVVLLERGTKLIGETRGQIRQGIARVFVLWTEARTPTGIVVPLDSPGTDELGRSGLAGKVNRHFWERFGAALLVSTLDGAVQAAVQSASRGGGSVIYNPSNPAGVASEVLKGTLNILPTINKRNGDRIQVFVARDVDFRSVYELRAISKTH